MSQAVEVYSLLLISSIDIFDVEKSKLNPSIFLLSVYFDEQASRVRNYLPYHNSGVIYLSILISNIGFTCISEYLFPVFCRTKFLIIAQCAFEIWLQVDK